MTDIGAKYDGLFTQDSWVFPCYIKPPAYDILIPYPWYYRTPMIYWPSNPWYIEPPSYGIVNPLFWQEWGGSIYHDEVQNTMTEIWPLGQNTIWSIFQGFEIPYDTGLGWVRFYSILISHVNIGFKDHRIPFFFYSGLNRFFCKLIYRTPGCFILS